ncbi:Eco57I restriction-modification methylase domain-containing protein [Chryseobacterium turcicum]|uniref:Eco57I restriction-modification methylase domain-containing protein n=1 Tax=Chryseobacterium turcicum TaxID=2898076 RepID=A0A9Q3YXL1_9FLAO|nr:Eco57I restriction-modification methylase domain-containing protein [Chryseobacterium turcicum]MCD1119129.1 Eco57I restriction-modification methylase domain-containing protein [Chryseobacterium turcicum]
MKYVSSLKLKLIYVFRINDEAHSGCLKIGEATSDDFNIIGLAPNSKGLNDAARKRINSYTQTAGVKYELLHTELAVYSEKGTIKSFSDTEVHTVLTNSGIKKKIFDIENKANEWYITDLSTTIHAIKAVRDGKEALHTSQISKDQTPIVFRPEQQQAIDKTKKQLKKGKEMLWFAKMRFGKTLTALQVVKDFNFEKSLILTHRPVVDAGWFEDFGKIFYDRVDFNYGSKNKGKSFAALEKEFKKDKAHYIYFASMQDLRGSSLVGGGFDKNNELFGTDWDFIIVDEAHEGTQTELGQNVLTELAKEKTKVLHLSGTPFNLLDHYKEEEIYTWDYVMEQKAKKEWDEVHFGDPNPYASLPKLNIFTFHLGKLLSKYADEEVAFNFREFFRVDEHSDFVHEKDVKSFLDIICKADKDTNYPYSTKEYRDNFRHSLWMVPGVKEARALSVLLQSHPVFSHFAIVNVAGDGDEEEKENDALKKVQKAITDKPHETYSITLSCGRLTTGVSVPAWSAVFMLSGSFNTSAANYMQTIFRVQTPAKIDGKIKEECFVFDFAPDRTLKVIAEAAKISAKAGKTSTEDRAAMGEFLNFCPIISVDGSRMETYNVEKMLEQLKKVYVERVVRNGFEDGYLYNNDQLMKMDDVELQDFEDLKGIIGSTKAMPKTADININDQGFTDEQFEQSEDAKKKQKQKKELSEEEKQLLQQRLEKKKNRDSAVSILRGISIRMPLLIYGADVTNEDTQIDIDNFSDLIDDKSWAEFMPKDVSKKVFQKFKKYYEPDVFRAAGKRIRAMARAADGLTVEERIGRIAAIFNTFRNPDKETVLTPWRVVNMHLSDCVGGYTFYDEKFENTIDVPRAVLHADVTANIFNSQTQILEINSKSGLYPLYMAYSTYRARILDLGLEDTTEIEQQQEIWDQVVAENIFVLCKTPMAKSITKRTLVGFRTSKVNTRYFEDLINQIKSKPQKFIKQIKQGKTYWKSNNNDSMKFDAIVGNPPYQLTKEGTSDNPIYHLFMDIAFKMSDKVSFITPARFLFNAGKTPKEWNEKILNDKHFRLIWYKSKSTDVFPNVDIKGGVAVTFRDATREFEPIGTFTSHETLNNILLKVQEISFEQSLSEIIYTQNKFDLKTLFENLPALKQTIGSAGKEKRLTSSIFSSLEIFTNKITAQNDIKVLGLIKNNRYYKYIDSKYIEDHINLLRFKVLIPKSNGTGKFGETLSTPVLAEPNVGYTQSFIGVGAFLERNEAESCLKYIKTKFVRALLGILKATQDNNKEVWKYVPVQDFSNKSDIDWNKSIIEEIDQQLYKKYNLSEEEISFIESMIKPMA